MTIEKYLLISALLTLSAIILFILIYITKKRKRKSLFGILEPYLSAFYSLFILLLIFFFILSSYRFFPPSSKVEFFESLIHHFDTTGLTIGIIGIIVGLITVIYVEKQNETNDQRVTDALNGLDEASRKIAKNVDALNIATKQIHRNVTNLKEVTTIKEIFEGIKETIKHAEERSNKLYVLTHLTSFGQFLIRNVQIVTRETQSQINDFKTLGAVDFYDIYMKPFDILKHSLDDSMRQYVAAKKEVEFAVLRNERINSAHVDKLEPFIRERIMKGKIAILINKNVNAPINYEGYSNEDIYIHNCHIDLDSNEPPSYTKQENVFVTDIMKYDLNFINSLKSRSNGNLHINTLDYVPFQFFVSAPKNEYSETDWRAIIIFSNYYNLGYDQSVVSFFTQNPNLCVGLKRMFEKLVQAQEKKDKDLNPIKRLFMGCSRINVALKNVDVGENEVSKRVGFRYVTPVPDIVAKDHLLILFKEFDIKYDPTALYVIKNSSKLQEIIENSSLEKTYLAVGLFYNPVTQSLSDLSPSQGNPLFKLIERNDPNGKNRIMIAVGGTVNVPKYAEYEETFNDKDINSCDYAFLCRLKINGRWIFAGGGINYFGSEYFEECIRYGASKVSEIVANKSFIAFFELKNTTPPNSPSPKLLHLSYINGDKIECEYC